LQKQKLAQVEEEAKKQEEEEEEEEEARSKKQEARRSHGNCRDQRQASSETSR
jgi:hypothetical protein